MNIEVDFEKIRKEYGSVLKFCQKAGFIPSAVYELKNKQNFVYGLKNAQMAIWLRDNGYLKKPEALKI